MSPTVPTPTGYIVLACITWTVYDYLITLDDEVELIWMRKWSFTKCIFLLLRWSTFLLLLTEVIVYVFLENLSKGQCDAISRANASRAFIVLIEVDIVLQLRIYVMYQRSRKLLWINALLMVVVAICSAVVVAKYFPKDHFIEVPDNIIGACYDVRPGILATVWVPPMCYELYLAILAVYKVVSDYRQVGRLEGGILAVLVRDSLIWFFLLVLVAVVNIISWIMTKVTPGASTVNVMHASGAVAGARLILSMRAAVLRPLTSPTNNTGVTMNFEMGDARTGPQTETATLGTFGESNAV